MGVKTSPYEKRIWCAFSTALSNVGLPQALHLLDAFFEEAAEDAVASAGQRELRAVVERGFELKVLQRSPHLVLLEKAFYHEHMEPILARRLLLHLKTLQIDGRPALAAEGGGALGAEVLGDFLLHGLDSASAAREVGANGTPQQIELLNLAHSLLHVFVPHCLAKIDRVNYGVLRTEDLARMARTSMVAPSRKLLAVPFVGKDVPSACSEFAHPDVVIGLTVLAYRYARTFFFSYQDQHMLS